MHSIIVFIYCYKNKNFYDIIKKLKEKSSNQNNIVYAVYDQNNEDKTTEYAAYKDVVYKHIFWDRKELISKYRNELLDKEYDYFFEIGNVLNIQQNWDNKLIEACNNSIILNDDISFLNLIFVNKQNSKILKQLSGLSFYGQYIYLLYLAYTNNIKIKKINENFVSFKINSVLESDYVPYPLYNKYNQIIEEIKTNKGFVDYVYNFYGFEVNFLNKKIYQQNMLDYSDLSYDSDDLKTTRFDRVKRQMVRSKNLKGGI